MDKKIIELRKIIREIKDMSLTIVEETIIEAAEKNIDALSLINYEK